MIFKTIFMRLSCAPFSFFYLGKPEVPLIEDVPRELEPALFGEPPEQVEYGSISPARCA